MGHKFRDWFFVWEAFLWLGWQLRKEVSMNQLLETAIMLLHTWRRDQCRCNCCLWSYYNTVLVPTIISLQSYTKSTEWNQFSRNKERKALTTLSCLQKRGKKIMCFEWILSKGFIDSHNPICHQKSLEITIPESL